MNVKMQRGSMNYFGKGLFARRPEEQVLCGNPAGTEAGREAADRGFQAAEQPAAKTANEGYGWRLYDANGHRNPARDAGGGRVRGGAQRADALQLPRVRQREKG